MRYVLTVCDHCILSLDARDPNLIWSFNVQRKKAAVLYPKPAALPRDLVERLPSVGSRDHRLYSTSGVMDDWDVCGNTRWYFVSFSPL